MSNDEYALAAAGDRGPVLLKPPQGVTDPISWLGDNRHEIDEILLRHGGVVLRDFAVNSVSEFNKVAHLLCSDLLDYVNRSTPRTKLGGKIYTATEYPADKYIALHNESSYADVWPSRILFYSAVVAADGGETPVADSRRVYQRIDPDIRERFERTGVMYVRNFTPGLDLGWQEVFQTDNRSDVERYCRDHGIDFEWHDGRPELTTRQRCAAVVRHPETAEPVWFNQAHLFHFSALTTDEQQAIIDEVGADNVPRNAFYGDGAHIEPEVLAHIHEAYEQERVTFPWQQGDVMVLDNLLVAHARNPFRGPRKVVVAMG